MEVDNNQMCYFDINQDEKQLSNGCGDVEQETEHDIDNNQHLNIIRDGISQQVSDNHEHLDQTDDLEVDDIKLEPRSESYQTLHMVETDVKKEIDDNSNASSTEMYTCNGDELLKNDPEYMVMYIQTNVDNLNTDEGSNDASISQNRRRGKGKKPQRRNSIEKGVALAYTCDERFQSKIDLEKPAKMHTNDIEYICKICGEQFKKKIEQKKHERAHNGPKKHTCEVCGKVFIRKNEFNGHMRTHTKEKPYLCPICGKGFRLLHHLKGHLITHTDNKPYVCEYCGRGFNDKSSMRRHIKLHQNIVEETVDVNGEKQQVKVQRPWQNLERKLECEHCGKSFYKAQHLKIHVRIHTGEKPHQCNDCGKLFNDPSSLRRHRKTYAGRPHILKEDKIKQNKCPVCETCGKKYHSNHHLRQHMKSHAADKPYKCTVCDKRFSTYSTCNCHKRKLVCKHCGKSFYKTQHLKIHVRIHTGEKPHQCNDCGKFFNDPSSLRRHRKTYAGRPHILKEDEIKQYKCPVCEKEFIYSTNFRYHVNRHNAEKSLECTTCGKKYHTKNHLRQHIKSHAADKPYRCTVCDKRFSTYSMWYWHTRTHKGGQKVQCRICYRYFLTGGHLKAHMTIHKGKEPY